MNTPDKNDLERLDIHIPPIDEAARQAVEVRHGQLTKPPGSLGQLERLAVELAGIQGRDRPSVQRKAVIVAAADHGVATEGTSAYPQEVTTQMVLNFLHGGAAINVLARQADARVVVADMGVASDLDAHPSLYRRKVAYGTQNMRYGPAMTEAQARQALRAGLEIIETEARQGLDVLAVGEMGIGNTTASAAIVAALTGLAPEAVTGRGTGVDDQGLQRKIEVIAEALAVNQPDPQQPLEVLTKVGGLEIAGLVGIILGAAASRVAILIDGFIASTAALLAVAFNPAVKPYLLATHQSVEIGHRVILNELGLKPLFDLGLRLGEGSGAALAFHLLEAAVRILNEMATFAEAGVSGKKT
ncbi:MAG: nicotinate-nucleotide--dimethylbenzimidazole phosphoribosyltransferase [Candidatus Entotheonella factor]|uniref:Nicotinate-nucleotide--dimethylbenzimidazole phosphoribosyltransferase n=3 Tax=Candidatus Entotheonella TaxID=93171 RepID=W4LCV4_ENTF1|nr:MAG: nicotinate-nucleotide--dimethylbenzimidazole phosphoribosyltransferase [Candidatus Entotheonella factor]